MTDIGEKRPPCKENDCGVWWNNEVFCRTKKSIDPAHPQKVSEVV